MNLPLVKEQADPAEGGIVAERAAELLQLGVFAVLVVLQGLSVAGGVGTVAAPERSRPLVLTVFGRHVLAELVFALAGVGADLTHEGLGLVSQLVALQLVHTVAAVGALVTQVPGTGGSGFSHSLGRKCNPELFHT